MRCSRSSRCRRACPSRRSASATARTPPSSRRRSSRSAIPRGPRALARGPRGPPPRSVPETEPPPLQKHYVLLSVPVLILGAIAITALEAGVPLGSPLIKLCVLVAAPLLVVTTADA